MQDGFLSIFILRVKELVYNGTKFEKINRLGRGWGRFWVTKLFFTKYSTDAHVKEQLSHYPRVNSKTRLNVECEIY